MTTGKHFKLIRHLAVTLIVVLLLLENGISAPTQGAAGSVEDYGAITENIADDESVVNTTEAIDSAGTENSMSDNTSFSGNQETIFSENSGNSYSENHGNSDSEYHGNSDNEDHGNSYSGIPRNSYNGNSDNSYIWIQNTFRRNEEKEEPVAPIENRPDRSIFQQIGTFIRLMFTSWVGLLVAFIVLVMVISLVSKRHIRIPASSPANMP